MTTQTIGIILNGVTGRMGANQHLLRSIRAIRNEGGVELPDGSRLMPDPILVGRDLDRLSQLADVAGIQRFTTDLEEALANPGDSVFFDSSNTLSRPSFIERAVRAGKAIYCEKPPALDTAIACKLANLCESVGVKNGVVQDKLWLPGIQKFKRLNELGFFGKILSVRGEFGYWVFSGEDPNKPPQRPSWNNRLEAGGGIITDMLCHYRYLIDNLFGETHSVSCLGATHIPTRVDEHGQQYACTADDACYATIECRNSVICQFNSSWSVRVRRDDLFTMHVDGTKGSAVVGLRKCWIQSHANTPRAVWNPDVEQPIDLFASWTEFEPQDAFDNAFKVQWEAFLRHVAADTPFPWTLREGAKGVQLAEAALKSWRERRWITLEETTCPSIPAVH